MELQTDSESATAESYKPVNIWGVPFAPVTYSEAMQLIERQADSDKPGYFITANMHYLMLTDTHKEMPELNNAAAFILADGMPIVWRSWLTNNAIPERVAGSDLIYSIAELAARKGQSIYFLGGAAGVAQSAAEILKNGNPGLKVAGVESPPFRELTPHEEAAMIERIISAKPDILLVAFGQPKGEAWIHRWHKQLGIPVSVQLGGSFNFVTGEVCRAPKWIAGIGMEWLYRFYKEPGRLGPRYLRNWMFLAKAILRDATNRW